ncbi:MAG: thymidine monophosphate kinase [Streblomastix strix]|uniref:dTMP kinase n=1 Tax=Streblomastix strix TaxID=222440 RepID=A0A5J4WMG9_9EUKA|nr:MAG: thymidine monophosphate kinase [Streblomastix strix]
MTSEKHRGLFIVLEGGDRTGKTTQRDFLAQFFSDQLKLQTEKISFPDRNEEKTGKILDDYLKKKLSDMTDDKVHTLYSDNRWYRKDYIENLLNSGVNLICDRYAYSGVAYTAAKRRIQIPQIEQQDKPLEGDARLSALLEPDYGLPAPDVVILFELDANEAMKRKEVGQEEIYEKTEFQREVCRVFPQLCKLTTGREPIPFNQLFPEIDQDQKSFTSSYQLSSMFLNAAPLWISIDASESKDMIKEKMEKIALSLIAGLKDSPIKIIQ